MSTYLDPENCMQVRQLAVSFGLNHLVRSVDNFVCENFEFVTGDQEVWSPSIFFLSFFYIGAPQLTIDQ